MFRVCFCQTARVDSSYDDDVGSLRNLDWFAVDEIRGSIKDGDVTEFQVTLKLGFRYEN